MIADAVTENSRSALVFWIGSGNLCEIEINNAH
jgi:hypothetical protein